MKPIYTLLIAVTFYSIANAQTDNEWHSLRKFRIDVTALAGDVTPNESNKDVESYAFMLGICPGYNVNDYMTVGVGYHFFQAYNGRKNEVSEKKAHLIMADASLRDRLKHSGNGWWQFGLSIGPDFYRNKIDSAFLQPGTGKTNAVYHGTGIALMPHWGFQYGRLLLDAAYLLSGNKGNNYYMLSVGFYLGGGRKNK